MLTEASRVPLRFGLNSVWLLMARLLTTALSLAFFALLARRLGDVGLGRYALIMAVVFVGNVFTTFGIDTLLIRSLARQDGASQALPGVALRLQLLLSMAFIGAIWLFAGLLPDAASVTAWALRIAVLGLLPLAVVTVYSAALRAYERMDLYLALQVLTTLAFTVIAGATLLTDGGGLVEVAVIYVVAQIGSALLAAILSRIGLPAPVSLRGRGGALIRRTLHSAWPLALLTIAAVLYQRVGVLLLSLLAGDGLTGEYAAAMRIVEGLKIPHQAALGALFPMLARAPAVLASVDQGTTRLFRRAGWALAGFSLVAAAIVGLGTGPIIRLLYGPDFEPAATALAVLLWSLPLYTVSAVISLDLVAAGQERKVLRSLTAGLIAAAALILVLLPTAGLVGACMGVIGGELVQAGSLWQQQRAARARRSWWAATASKGG